VDETGVTELEAPAKGIAHPETNEPAEAAEAVPVGRKPELLDVPRGGGGDDLKQIRGIGPELERTLNGLGVWHLAQIARWDGEEVAWIDAHLEGFKGRITRDDWVGQARELSGGA
jgi:NADH-quinone oxidoreductase subunit E